MISTNTMDLIGDVTHRMRGSLTVVQEYASLMGEGHAGPLSSEQRRMCDVIRDRSDDMCHAIDELLLACRLGAGTLDVSRQPCDLIAIVEEAVQQLARRADRKGVSLCHRIDPSASGTFGDPAMIHSAISMIVADGIDQLDEADRLVVAAEVDKLNSRIIVSFFAERPEAVPPQAAPRSTGVVCREQFAEKRELSPRLVLVRQIVELNLGRLDVQAAEGPSESVFLMLPLDVPVEVLRRFLERAGDLSGSWQVSLSRLRWDDLTGTDAGDDRDYLLRSVAVQQDLIFRTGDDRWIVATCHRESDTASLAKRFEAFCMRANQVRPEEPVHSLLTEDLGTWSIPGCPPEAILDALQTALDADSNPLRQHMPNGEESFQTLR